MLDDKLTSLVAAVKQKLLLLWLLLVLLLLILILLLLLLLLLLLKTPKVCTGVQLVRGARRSRQAGVEKAELPDVCHSDKLSLWIAACISYTSQSQVETYGRLHIDSGRGARQDGGRCVYRDLWVHDGCRGLATATWKRGHSLPNQIGPSQHKTGWRAGGRLEAAVSRD